MARSSRSRVVVDQGQRLLDEINVIRAVQGLVPLDAISLAETDPASAERCPVAVAAACTVARGKAPQFERRFTLRFRRGIIARMAGYALDQPHNEETREVLAPPTIRTFVIAASYGLTLADENETLRGWIDPADVDPSLWQLHLMPGHKYPRGHNPTPRRGKRKAAIAAVRSTRIHVAHRATALLRLTESS